VSGYLGKDCKIWLPNLDCTRTALHDFHDYLAPYYDIGRVQDPKLNPLFLATEDVEEKLMLCPDKLTNANQIVYLLEFSGEPFFMLQLRN